MNKYECLDPSSLLNKVYKGDKDAFMRVQSKNNKPYWKKKGEWITLKADTPKDRFFHMSESTYNKIKDYLRVTTIAQ